MAGFHIHIAIGKVYLKNYQISDTNAFFKGIIAPDLGDKDLTHYTNTNRDKRDLIDYLAKKVNLYQYLLNNNITNDYDKGVFLHLITDYLFFNNFFEKEYLLKTNHSDFVKDLYYSYDLNNKHLEVKYDLKEVSNNETIKSAIQKSLQGKENNAKRNNILDNKKVDEFIKEVGKINLDNYREKVLKYKDNI